MTDVSGTTGYSYDNRDRLQGKTVAWNGGPAIAVNYGYDANGTVTNIFDSGTSGGVHLAYGYDALGRLTNVWDNGTARAGYTFDLAGNLQAMRYANGVTNLCQYDSLNRLTNEVWNTNGVALATFYYQLGLTGNRTNVTESLYNGSINIGRTNQWLYDHLYRLTNEIIKTASTGTLGYSYDGVGNRTSRTVSGLALSAQTLAYNTNDWLTTDAYDSNGNTVLSTNGAVQGPYFYDVENRLTNYNNSVYMVYDGDGNRMSKTVRGTTTDYLVDDQNPSGYAQVLEERTASGGVTNLSRVYNYGLALISQRVPGSSTNYFIFDGHGSTRMLTDAGSNFVNAFAYDAYGTLIESNASPQTLYLYCGQQFDADLGMSYNRARFLNLNTGRFWTMDTADGNNEDPLSLHKYLYCEANPIDGEDPSGHDDIGGVLGAMDISFSLGAIISPVTSNAKSSVTLAIKNVNDSDIDSQLNFVYGKILAWVKQHDNVPVSKESFSTWEQMMVYSTVYTAYRGGIHNLYHYT